jgi:hypothetical protein
MLRASPNMEKDVAQWCEQANQIYAALNMASRNAARNKEGAEDTLKITKERLEEHWKAGQQHLLTVLLRALSEPMDAEIIYAMALAKQEQAERLEMVQRKPGAKPTAADRQTAADAWKAAASWWSTLEQEHFNAPGIGAARRLHARACQALQQKDAAITLLENFSGPIVDAEKTARLYQAKQLRQ